MFLLGNGFDKNQDLATSYKEFYDYYLALEKSGVEAVDLLRKSISADIENWADLEWKLGQFTSLINTQQELDTVILDLVNHLKMYLQEIEKKIDYDAYSREKLINDLVNPERVLSERDKRSIREFKKPFHGNEIIQVHILTFNYTKIIENVLGNKYTNLELGTISKQQIRLGGVEHIHGYVQERLILGLNDIGQISNEELRGNIDAVELLVKPSHNESLGHLRDELCLQRISHATMIYVFGSSIGETDKIWWQAVGARLQQQCCLVIFYRGEDTEGRPEVIEERKGRALVEHFLSLTDLNEQEKDKAKKKIYTATTKDLFKLN